jgi:hypothetical protein
MLRNSRTRSGSHNCGRGGHIKRWRPTPGAAGVNQIREWMLKLHGFVSEHGGEGGKLLRRATFDSESKKSATNLSIRRASAK